MLKDQKLDEFAKRGVNIAQFVSYGPDGKKRYARIRGTYPRHRYASIEGAVEAIRATGAAFVNIRTFRPNRPDGNPFFMGRKERWTSVVEPADIVRSHLQQGYYVIVNEDIDVNDGGFSGVIMGEMAEFAPKDTPRCVENTKRNPLPCAAMSRALMEKLVLQVYQRRVGFPYSHNHRIEFSVHPGPVGYLREPYLMWQEESIERGTGPSARPPEWPNRYSVEVGDKAFGLLMASLCGIRVPYTRVDGRLVPPFIFGDFTSSAEMDWIRTCPRTQDPGQFTTKHGHLDPFELMQQEDPDGTRIASILHQKNVDAAYAGGAIGTGGTLTVEGAKGYGDDFMLGRKHAEELPPFVHDAVHRVWQDIKKQLGSVRFEWVVDQKHQCWIVQLHVGRSESHGNVIYPGEPSQRWETYDATQGLDGLRRLIRDIQASRHADAVGVKLIGNVGITSHFGDLLRRAKIPSRLEHPPEQKTA